MKAWSYKDDDGGISIYYAETPGQVKAQHQREYMREHMAKRQHKEEPKVEQHEEIAEQKPLEVDPQTNLVIEKESPIKRSLEIIKRDTENEIHRPPSPPPKNDIINHPNHYCYGGIETIDFIKAKLTPEEFRGFLKGTAIKYQSRAGHKDDEIQDLKKARWYQDRLISELENERKST